MMTETMPRSVSRYLKRASVTSRASDNSEKISRRARGVGPVLKKGGGEYSIQHSERGVGSRVTAIALTRAFCLTLDARHRILDSVVRENANQPVDFFKRLARA